MIKVLAFLLALMSPALAQSTGAIGSDCRLYHKVNTAIICAYIPSDSSGLQLLVSAFEKNNSPITSISIVTGKNYNKVRNICYSTSLCQYFWPKSDMALMEDYMITAIAQNGARIVVKGNLDRP